MLLSDAKKIYVGTVPVKAVYAGAVEDWPARPTYAERVRALGALSHWRLGEASGTVAVDELGYHHAVYTGAPTLGVPGLLTGDADTAMQVAGVLKQGLNAGTANFNLWSGHTFECWVKTTNAGSGFRSIVVKHNDSSIFTNDNQVVSYDWGSSLVVASGVNIADGLPHHVVAVFAANFADATSQLYVDGVAVGASFRHTSQSMAGSLAVGYNDFDTQEFIGVIDEVAIYARKLTAAEVAENHAIGTNPDGA